MTLNTCDPCLPVEGGEERQVKKEEGKGGGWREGQVEGIRRGGVG